MWKPVRPESNSATGRSVLSAAHALQRPHWLSTGANRMKQQRCAPLVWGMLLFVFTSLPNMLLAQSRTSTSRDRSLERAGAQLRTAYTHAVRASFFDTLTVCASSRSPRAVCEAGRTRERAAREIVRAGLARGFGAVPPAATFARVLRIRAENARDARQSGGSQESAAARWTDR